MDSFVKKGKDAAVRYLRGWVRAMPNLEEVDIYHHVDVAFLESDTKPPRLITLSEGVMWILPNHLTKVKVSYVTSDAPCDFDDALEHVTEAALGIPQRNTLALAYHCHPAYSELTPGEVFVDTRYSGVQVGGHNLEKELLTHQGRYVVIRIEEIQHV